MIGRFLLMSVLLAGMALAGCVDPAPAPLDPATVDSDEGPVPPTFRFSWSPEDPRPEETIRFEVVPDDPAVAVADAVWSFGDGTSRRAIAPEKVYREPGTYPVEVELETTSGHQTVLSMDLLVARPAVSATPDGEQPAGNGTAGDSANATAESGQPDENGTTPRVYEPIRDLLLDQQYRVLPVHDEGLANYEFEVGDGYDVLELVGRLETPVHYYADNLALSVYGPDGTEVITFSGTTTAAAHIGDSMSNTNFPIGYHYGPEPGTYTVEVSGASAKELHVWAFGNAGLAPDFTYRDVVTQEIGHLSDHVGKVVLIDLMATWCGPCHDAMPSIQALAADYPDTVDILSIDVDATETDDDLRGMKEQYDSEWIWAFEVDNSASEAYGTGWIPSFALVDQHGGLLYRQIGAFDDDKVRELIEWTLEER